MAEKKDVVIKTGDGELIPVNLDSNPTVADLKKLISERQGRDTSPFALRAGPRVIPDDVHIAETEYVRGDVTLIFTESLPRGEAVFRAPDGRYANTRFSRRTTVAKAVTEISKVLNFTHPEDFVVLYNGRELTPDTILADLQLSKDAVLRIDDIPKELRITYQSPDGKRKVASTRYRGIATVAAVRARLASAFSLSSARTALFFNGERLADDAVLADLGLSEDGFLELKPAIDVSIGTVTSLSPAATPNSSIDVGSLSPVRNVEFRTPTKKVAAHFKPAATVGKAKEKLAARLDVGPEQLWVSRIAKTPDDQFLRETEIVSNDELIVHVYRPLTIRGPGGKRVRARFAETATVRSTKEKLADAFGIPVDAIEFVELQYENEDTKLQDIAIPESGVITVRESRAEAEKEEEEEEEELDDDADQEDDDEEGAAQRSPVTKDDVRTVKLVFPDGTRVRVAHRKKATIAKARLAAAEELGKPVEKIVLTYNEDELNDDTIIDNLCVPRKGRIAVTVIE
jgi:hypothetical protein